MKFELAKLKNGVRVLLVPMPSLESATATIWVNVGSRYESDRIAGLSHFLEHMAFKGSKKRPTAKEISSIIDSIGGEFNAGTSKEWTNFYIKARSGNMKIAYDVLFEMFMNPLLKEEEIEREKGVIVEEINMYEDTPMIKIGDVFEDLIFKGSKLGRDIAGTPETVRGLKRSDFVSYRDNYYFAENILLAVAGGFDRKEVMDYAEKYLGILPNKSLLEAETFKPIQKKPEIYLYSKKKDQVHFILGFRGNPRGHKDRFAESILASILGGGMSSRLFLEVRERRGLAYAVRADVDHYKETGYLSCYAGVDPKKADEAVTVALNEFYSIANGKKPIDKEELDKSKEFIKGHLALSLEDTRDVNEFFASQELLIGKIETPEEVFKKLDAVTISDVTRVAKELFIPERLNLGIIGPYKDKKIFEKLLV